MYISVESQEQTAKRLLKVIAAADLRVLEGDYVFEEFPLPDFQSKARSDALAFVRDEDVWSQLVPAGGRNGNSFKLMRFHFAENLDNSGFVGWLASHLKQKIGTGVFVVCGQNFSRGGIFDYWGCPLEVAGAVLNEIHNLIQQGKRLSTPNSTHQGGK